MDSSRHYQLLPFVTIGQSRAPLATTSTLQTANAITRTALTFIIGLWGRLDDCSDNTVNEWLVMSADSLSRQLVEQHLYIYSACTENVWMWQDIKTEYWYMSLGIFWTMLGVGGLGFGTNSEPNLNWHILFSWN